MFAKQQDRSTDSLKRLVTASLKSSAKPDTLIISWLDKLAEKYFESIPDSTTYYGNLQVKLSKQINFKKGVADGLAHIADVNTFRGDYEIATRNYTTALNLYEEIGYAHGICIGYRGLGYIQDYLGNYDTALTLYNKALRWCSKTADESDQAECYNLMGITYNNKGEFSKSLDCYFKALFFYTKHNNHLSAANVYSNIGLIMHQLEMYPKAISYFNKALSVWERLHDQQGISTGCQNIGETLIAQQRYSEAIKFLRRASVIFHRLDDTDGKSLVYYDLGLYHYYTKNLDSALYYLNLSLSTSANNKILFNRANANIGFALVYNLEKKYQQAYNHAIQAQNIGAKLNSLSIKTNAALALSKAPAGSKTF
ncbi:tetratricopeptide repeat protein [Mucilaginibacter sp. S1162]|uniref:Tetratricopeptide repeat protein n=1 Tax=Mucilaginibacter humi TaxID=2732510 RepID=A0ABX1W6C9_9SPHI|nr:tetratricopeptide repeat protein [Mucilaginibacter humi]NNU33622.1 tetratricopeptide repeat protein [Mucilaginibacter humi]